MSRATIEATILARNEEVVNANAAIELIAAYRLQLSTLRIQLDALTTEFERSSAGEVACAGDLAAVHLVRDRIGQWCEDGGMVHVDLLAELLDDIDEMTA